MGIFYIEHPAVKNILNYKLMMSKRPAPVYRKDDSTVRLSLLTICRLYWCYYIPALQHVT
jgi:hypothetical protein